MNENAKDVADDEVVEGEAGTVTGAGTATGTETEAATESEAATETEAATADERHDAGSAEAGVSQQEVPETPATGESAVDDALARLSQIGGAPTADHVEIYDDVHRRLTDALADVDED